MPIGINAVRDALTSGDHIMVTLVPKAQHEAGLIYSLKSSGRAIPHRTFAKLKGDLIPADMGLLDDAPQSFVLKPEA